MLDARGVRSARGPVRRALLSFPVNRILGAVALAIAALVALSVFVDLLHYKFGFNQIGGAYRLFSLDMEGSVPTMFSALLLVACAGLVAVHARIVDTDLRYWAGIAAMLLYVGVDEAVQLHEPVMYQMRRIHPLGGYLYFDWTLPAIVILSVVGLLYLRFLLRQPPPLRNRLIVAAAVYVSGALGMELVDGKYASIHGENNLTYDLLTTVEETLEMIGAALMLRAMLRRISPADIVLRMR